MAKPPVELTKPDAARLVRAFNTLGLEWLVADDSPDDDDLADAVLICRLLDEHAEGTININEWEEGEISAFYHVMWRCIRRLDKSGRVEEVERFVKEDPVGAELTVIAEAEKRRMRDEEAGLL